MYVVCAFVKTNMIDVQEIFLRFCILLLLLWKQGHLRVENPLDISVVVFFFLKKAVVVFSVGFEEKSSVNAFDSQLNP